jgi:hypothetical protein
MKQIFQRTLSPSFVVAVIALAMAVGGATALGQSVASQGAGVALGAGLAGPGTYHNVTTYENGWASYPKADGFGLARYYKDTVGIVHLEGVIYGGGGNNYAFRLPKGYRPLVTHAFVVAATTGNSFVDVDVYPSGKVLINGLGDPASLDGISFRTR